MRPDQARRMWWAIWAERLRTYGLRTALLAACAVIGGWLFVSRLDRIDATVSLSQLNGTVLAAHRVAGRAAIYVAQIVLDDGKEVQADSTLAAVLLPRERVIVSEARHASGKVSYHILQVLN